MRMGAIVHPGNTEVRIGAVPEIELEIPVGSLRCGRGRSRAAMSRRASEHEPDVRTTAGVGEDDLLQLVRGDAHPDGRREQVDDLGGIRAQKMSAQDAARALLDQHLAARTPSRRPAAC